MIVPRFWAEARIQHREPKRQLTIRRFGWSQNSEQEAQANAEARAGEALRRTLAGEKLLRREPKVAYNGAEGVPIREEIVAEHGDTIITRNSYGALCLNTPDVLFADVDFEPAPTYKSGCLLMVLLLAPSAWLAWINASFKMFLGLIVVSAFAGQFLAWFGQKAFLWMNGGARNLASRRIRRFIRSHPDWRLRLYRTPAGYRVLVTHRTFPPDEPVVSEFFHALGTDPIYVRMCQRQRCFRARVSPKPWRIGIAAHLKPRPNIWPMRPEALARRQAWVAAYQEKAAGYSSCQFEGEFGHGKPDEIASTVQVLHDRLCRADTSLPIA